MSGVAGCCGIWVSGVCPRISGAGFRVQGFGCMSAGSADRSTLGYVPHSFGLLNMYVREREGARERVRKRERERDSERVSVCVREREHVCVCVRERK